MKINNFSCCIKRISFTFNKHILLILVVDKTHSRTQHITQPLSWNEFIKYIRTNYELGVSQILLQIFKNLKKFFHELTSCLKDK